MKRGRQLRRTYCLSSDQVCSPHSHLNMRTVRPFTGLSIVRSMDGFLPQMPQALTELGSKLEKTSFLKPRSIGCLAVEVFLSYQTAHKFRHCAK